MKTVNKGLSLFLMAVFVLGLFSGLSPIAWAAPVDITAKFTDQNFRAAVYQHIGKTAPAPIYDTDVAGIEDLDVSNREIQSLAGLEYFVNLIYLNCLHNRLTSLPELPSGLRRLDCINNQLTSLPALPSGLEVFYCNNNRLTSLPALPSGLEGLDCSWNRLTSLPELPSGLERLNCYINQLTSLPTLPSSLKKLDCHSARLTSLPALPSGLEGLDCSWNRLTSLPELPSGLEELNCRINRLTSLPTLPSGLKKLDCVDNQLTSLPTLPSGLLVLECRGNQLTSLPTLPSGLRLLACNINQLTSLPALPSGLKKLNCAYNQLTGIDATGLTLNSFHCTNNNMKSPTDVKGFPDIWEGHRYSFYPQRSVKNPPAFTGMSSWAKAEITSLENRKVIPNALRSGLYQPINRDEFTALLVNVYQRVAWIYYAYQYTPFTDIASSPYKSFFEIALFIEIAYDIELDTPFTDIASSPYKSFIEIAYYLELVDGTSPTTFSPDGLLTREQAAKLLYTMVNIIKGASLGDAAPDFTDNAKSSPWAVPYVAFCQENGLIQGKDAGKFDPQGNLTREEAMLVAERLIVQYKLDG